MPNPPETPPHTREAPSFTPQHGHWSQVHWGHAHRPQGEPPPPPSSGLGLVQGREPPFPPPGSAMEVSAWQTGGEPRARAASQVSFGTPHLILGVA